MKNRTEKDLIDHSQIIDKTVKKSVSVGNAVGIGSMYYTYTDYLGSILKVTDDAGNTVAEQSFDAWGRKRNATNWGYSSIASTPDWLYRGYTGHEHYGEFALINMNGRMYDPTIGRMLSADNYVQNGASTQAYNRYTYAANNPLKYTDPSGEVFGLALGAFLFTGVIAHFSGATSSEVFRIAGTAALTTAVSAGVTGAVSASLSVGGFKGGAIAGAAGGAAGGTLSGAGSAIYSNTYLGTNKNIWLEALKGAGVGALAGGLIGGSITGIQAQNNGYDFWDGTIELTADDVNYLTASKGDALYSKSPGQVDFTELNDAERTVHIYKWMRHQHRMGSSSMDLNQAFSNFDAHAGNSLEGFNSGIFRMKLDGKTLKSQLSIFKLNDHYGNLQNSIFDFGGGQSVGPVYINKTNSNWMFFKNSGYRWGTESNDFDKLYKWLGY